MMKTKNTRFSRRAGLVIVLGMVAGISACRKDLDEITTDTWQPVFALPLAHSTFNVQDILDQSDTVANLEPYGNMGQLALRYTGELFSLDLDSVLTLEPQVVTLGHTLSESDAEVVESGTTVTLPISLDYALDTDPAGVRVDEALLLAGTMTMDVDFMTGESLVSTLQIPQLIDPDGLPYTLFIDSDNGDLLEVVDLSGYTIVPDHPEPYTNGITVEAQLTIENNEGYVSQAGDGFDVEVTLEDMDFQHVIGDFGNLEIQVDRDSVELSVFSNSVQVDDFGFDEVYIDLWVTNSFGIPAFLDLSDVESENLETGEITLLNLQNNFELAGQATLDGPPEEVVFGIDHTNSNIVQMIAPAPQEVRFSGVAVANPNGPPPPESPNFITANSSIDVDISVTLPLAGYVQNLTLLDTLNTQLDLDLGDEVDSVEFRIFTDNGFPLEGELQVIFLDAFDQPLDSLFLQPENLISPAPVGNDGFPVGTSEQVQFVTLSQARFETVRTTQKVIVFTRLNTTDSNNQTVVTFDDQTTLEVKLGVKIYAHADL